ncbi:MAG: two-component system response regulator [Cycloclasticus sp.]|nr:MAG: two-component system response regulator [Cycloclasticus sp.]
MSRILVIDDSPTELHIITKMLEKNGHEFITASDGDEGIIVAKQEKPDLIIMDVVMPNLNGFKATRSLTRDGETKHIPVVILSSKSMPTDKLWGEKQGAKDYLFKPVDESLLMQAIVRLVA